MKHHTQFAGATATLNLPNWVTDARFEQYDEEHGGLAVGNRVKCALFAMPNVQEVYFDHLCWLRVELRGSRNNLHARILTFQKKLNAKLDHFYQEVKRPPRQRLRSV